MRHVITVAVVLGLACGGEEQPQQPPATNAPATPQPVGQAQPVAPAGGAATPTPTPAAGAGQSNFGTVALRPGFTPDPHVVRGTSGGAIQASNLNAQCRGWISQTPDHLFNAQGPFNNLRFVVNAGSEDTTLVVQKPDGTYLCNDDTDGFHPVVAGAFPPGMYKVWVGSYQRGTQAAYQLGISELGSVPPSSLGGGSAGGAAGAGAAQLDLTGSNANFQPVSLRPGFTPDPHVVTGTSGGSVNATSVNPSCRGWIARVPDHLFTASGAFNNLRVMVNSAQDTTLVVRKPDGTFVCDDDSEGMNPMVTGSFPPGQYRVWVGSYQQGQNAAYRLGFSELSSVTPNSIAQ